MKTLKNSKQKSFVIAMDMYTTEQYIEMLENEDLRINHSSVAEIKVVYNREFD